MTVEISENLNFPSGNPDRFCAVLTEADGDPIPYDMGGFGATEADALRDLAGQVGLSDDNLGGATYVRFALR